MLAHATTRHYILIATRYVLPHTKCDYICTIYVQYVVERLEQDGRLDSVHHLVLEGLVCVCVCVCVCIVLEGLVYMYTDRSIDT